MSKNNHERNSAFIHELTAQIEGLRQNFIEHEHLETAMTGKERLRLFGAGVRNYGFIEKTYEIAAENPDFIPRAFKVETMRNSINELDELRQLLFLLEQFMQIVNECMLVKADSSFRDALRIYGNLRELNRSKVPGAEALYRALLQYFRRPKRPGEPEQTEKELEQNLDKMVQASV